MPVHWATTSAMSSASTSSLKKRFSWRSRPRPRRPAPRRAAARARGSRRSAARRRARGRRRARRARPRAAASLEALAQVADAVRSRPSRPATRPSSRRRARCRSASSRSIASRRSAVAVVLLLAQRRALDLELLDAPLDLVDLGRHRVDLDLQRARRPRRSGRSPCRAGSGRRCSGRDSVAAAMIAESWMRDAVVHLVALLEPAQDRDRVLDVGSPTITGWKRRSSAASFSMCLRYSSSVVAPTARSSPRASIGFSRLAASTAPSAAPAPTIVCSSSMKRMISPCASCDLLEDGLQAVLELAAVLRAGDQRADVERDHAAVAQRLGHVAGDDPLGEALDDRGLADAGLADQDRVVLRAAAEHLDHAADLLVAADHRVELALLGALGQVAAVPLAAPRSCSSGFWSVTRCGPRPRRPRRAAPRASRRLAQDRATAAVLLGEREQQVLGRRCTRRPRSRMTASAFCSAWTSSLEAWPRPRRRRRASAARRSRAPRRRGRPAGRRRAGAARGTTPSPPVEQRGEQVHRQRPAGCGAARRARRRPGRPPGT